MGVEGRAIPFLLLEVFWNSMASTVQKNWGGVPAGLPGLCTTACTTPFPRRHALCLPCVSTGLLSWLGFPCVACNRQPLQGCMQPAVFESLPPWCRPLTVSGPGTAQPPTFVLGSLNSEKHLETIQPWSIRGLDFGK